MISLKTIMLVSVGVALSFYAALVIGLIVAKAWKPLKRQSLAMLVFMGIMLHVAATKPQYGRITYPYTDIENRYIYDRGSYVTNDLIHVDFTVAPFVPKDAPLYGYFQPVSETNKNEWCEFIAATFETFPVPQDIIFPGAETNNFVFFTTWTPGPAAHTNGVAVVYWRQAEELEPIAAPLRTGIYINCDRVAPAPAITNGPTAVLILEEE